MSFKTRQTFVATIVLLITGLLSVSTVHAQERRPFKIYMFVPWHAHMENGQPTKIPNLQDYFRSLGLFSVKVIYDYSTNGQPDAEKIRAIATASQSDVPVSFDTEFGNRFKPETVIPKVDEILKLYRQSGGRAPVGLYATIPIMTYGWKPDMQKFDHVNSQYVALADKVDYFSPGLYNYNGHNIEAWRKAASYNISAAKNFGTNKPIIPYITPQVTDKASGVTDLLSEQEMKQELETLYNQGAAGCIIWASSNFKPDNGNNPTFDKDSGWAKAVVDFAKQH